MAIPGHDFSGQVQRLPFPPTMLKEIPLQSPLDVMEQTKPI